MSDDESPWIDMDGNINEMSPENKSPTTYSRPNTPEIDKLKSLLKLAKENGNKNLGKNLFIKALDLAEKSSNKLDINKYGGSMNRGYMPDILENVQIEIDKLTVDTRTKNVPEYNNRLINAYRELTSAILKDKETGKPITNDKNVSVIAEFAEDLFNYLIVRDGLQFANGSFLKYIAPEMYLDLSDVLKELTDAFREGRWDSDEFNLGITALLVMNKNDFVKQFIKLYSLK